jgi:hypothetical protein
MGKEVGRRGSFKDLVVVMFVAASGCTGVVGLPRGSTGTGVSGAGSGSGGGSTSGAGSNIGAGSNTGLGAADGGTVVMAGGLWALTPTTTIDSGRAVLKRLNNPEYDNTVRDLVGTMSKASATYMFPDDDISELFDTNGQTLVYSDLLFAQVQSAAQGLVTELLARPATDPVRTRLLTCTPTMTTLGTCLTTILTPFMTSAYRRPVTSAEVAQIVTLATTIATAHNDPVPGLSGALEAVLLSPNFLFRVEPSTNIASTTPTKVSDYELATRLSYFLGSTMPDAQLTQAAAAGQLSPAGTAYNAQIDRLLADPVRSQAFVDNFAERWLSLSDALLVAPDDTIFAGLYDDALRLSAPQETSMFFASLVADKQPLATLLTANFTFVNDSLAQHYGIPYTGGTTFGRVTLPASSNRMGLLTQETFLTVTSQPDRTSPVKRGVWVLENLLCDGTPAPPPGIPQLPAQGTGTVRQVLETHRAQAFCSSCHSLIDPIGLSLENFDAIGSYRTLDNGVAIDASATMLDGTTFTGSTALANYVAKDPRLAWCLTKQVMTFGVGRTFEPPDGRAYVMGVANQMNANPTWPDLIKAVANSQAFLTSRGESQ